MRKLNLLICFVLTAASFVFAQDLSAKHPEWKPGPDQVGPYNDNQHNAILHKGLSDPAQLDDIEITAGAEAKGIRHWNVKVTLTAPAPAGGATIGLSADPENSSTMPAKILIPEGQTEISFSAGRNPLATEGEIYANYITTKSASLPIPPPVTYDDIIDKMIANEHTFVTMMKGVHPLIETYIQNLHEDVKTHDVSPVSDKYFLERLNLADNGYVNPTVFDGKKDPGPLDFLSKFTGLTREFMPQGFAQMIFIDPDMKKENYDFAYVRREFIGDIRCIVFDIRAKQGKIGLFVGRVWVEDANDNIVRFDGTYAASKSRRGVYLHFDSWRSNLQPGLWLPTYVFSEETAEDRGGARMTESKLTPVQFHDYYFKAQVRLWDYDPDPTKHMTQMTEVKVEDVATTAVEDISHDYSPLESERMWQRQAEDNALDHLQKIGILAPSGDVDKVVQTVANNIIATNNLDIPEVRCRVLLTTPIESFTIGNTIVMSRGLLDVLPDEASLAAMLSHELAHIALGHRLDEKFAFNDKFFFPDAKTFQRMNFVRNPLDEAAADAKAKELLAKSPYKDKLAQAGLFLEALNSDSSVLSSLISPHFGNTTESKQSHLFGLRHTTMKVDKMSALLQGAPKLEVKDLNQIAALPLGSRVKLNSWGNDLTLMNFKAVPKLSAQDKMPFEVAPMFVYLTRVQ